MTALMGRLALALSLLGAAPALAAPIEARAQGASMVRSPTVKSAARTGAAARATIQQSSAKRLTAVSSPHTKSR